MPQIEDTSDLPETIYHYCPKKGFRGILESKVLWLSDVHCMNDDTEQKWLLDMAKKRLHELQYGDRWRDILPIIMNWEKYSHDVYAFCFNKKVDLRGQWSEYADDGKGYSIGFSPHWFRSQTKIHRRYLALWNVEYDKQEQNKSLNHYIEEYLKKLKNGADRTESGIRLVLAINALSGVCKNSDFFEEDEIRLFFIEPKGHSILKPPEIKGISEKCYRTSDRFPKIPYFTLSFPEQAITSIYLGPRNEDKNDHTKTLNYLSENGYDIGKIKIIDSEISLDDFNVYQCQR